MTPENLLLVRIKLWRWWHLLVVLVILLLGTHKLSGLTCSNEWEDNKSFYQMIKLYFIINHSITRLGHKLESEIFFLPTDVPTKFLLSSIMLSSYQRPRWRMDVRRNGHTLNRPCWFLMASLTRESPCVFWMGRHSSLNLTPWLIKNCIFKFLKLISRLLL